LKGAKDHIELNYRFSSWEWKDMPGAVESWAKSFVNRVADISSLGNVMSAQNRFVQKNYLLKERELRDQMVFQPPMSVLARGTLKGAVVSWENRHASARGFYLYRDGRRVNAQPLPPTARSFEDTVNGSFAYTVQAVDEQDRESSPSISARCQAGTADASPPRIVVISPPGSAIEGQPVWLKARALDNRENGLISMTLHYRKPGGASYTALRMARRTKAVFTAAIPGREVAPAGLEYYFSATDGSNPSVFPPSAPALTLSLVAEPAAPGRVPSAPRRFCVRGTVLSWEKSVQGGEIAWYRIYRGTNRNFQPGPDSFLTYVAGETPRFEDNGMDLQGTPLLGLWYYRLTAVDAAGRESAPSSAVVVQWPDQTQ